MKTFENARAQKKNIKKTYRPWGMTNSKKEKNRHAPNMERPTSFLTSILDPYIIEKGIVLLICDYRFPKRQSLAGRHGVWEWQTDKEQTEHDQKARTCAGQGYVLMMQQCLDLLIGKRAHGRALNSCLVSASRHCQFQAFHACIRLGSNPSCLHQRARCMLTMDGKRLVHEWELSRHAGCMKYFVSSGIHSLEGPK